MFNSYKKGLLSYLIFSLLITGLSLLFLFINIYEITLSLFISFVFNFTSLYFMLNFGRKSDSKYALNNHKNVLLFNFLKQGLEIISLVIIALCIYFIPPLKNSPIQDNKRSIYIFLNLLPLFMNIIWFYLIIKRSKNENL